MSEEKPPFTILPLNCKRCTGRFWYAVSIAQANEIIDHLKQTRAANCTATYKITRTKQ